MGRRSRTTLTGAIVATTWLLAGGAVQGQIADSTAESPRPSTALGAPALGPALDRRLIPGATEADPAAPRGGGAASRPALPAAREPRNTTGRAIVGALLGGVLGGAVGVFGGADLGCKSDRIDSDFCGLAGAALGFPVGVLVGSSVGAAVGSKATECSFGRRLGRASLFALAGAVPGIVALATETGPWEIGYFAVPVGEIAGAALGAGRCRPPRG